MEELKERIDRSLASPLEMSRRLLGSSFVVDQEQGASDITVRLDAAEFVRRLLLFDAYILYSVRLKEIPELVRRFGYEGTLALLNSGAIEIRCECAQFGEGRFNTPPYPLLTFQFHVIEAHIRDQYVIDNLSEVNRTPGLNSRELMALQSAVMRAVKQPDNREMFSKRIAPAFENDVLHNTPLVKTAVRVVLARQKGIADIGDFEIKFHKVRDDRYEAETDLPKKLGLSAEEVHNTLKLAVLGISSVDQRIGEMQAHTALSGFMGDELPLFRSKLDSIADLVNSERQERRFQRLVDLAGLRDINGEARIDIEKVLEIRNEPEALEFRAFLVDLDRLTDAEIRDRVNSFNAKLGLRVQTVVGKLMRVLVTTVAGFEPHAGVALGVVLGVLDQFAWDKLARRSGITAFVHELYPSIFEQRRTK